MAIENVRHPIKDTVKADNSTYSSNKIESLIHSATELPETSVADAGDVLMVNDEGEWDKGEITHELPEVTTSDNTKVLTVKSGAWDVGPKLVPPLASNIGHFLFIQSGNSIGAKALPAIRSLAVTRSSNTITLLDPAELSECITALSSGGIVTIKDVSGVWSISGYTSNSIDIFRIAPEDASHITIECATLNATSNTITSYTMSAS